MSKSMFVLVAVLALALAIQAGPHAGKNKDKADKDNAVNQNGKGNKGSKGLYSQCKDKFGDFDKKAKTCDETNAAAKQKCLGATPAGKWKNGECKARTVPPFKACKNAYGSFNRKTGNCDMSDAKAKEQCLTVTEGKWKSGECKAKGKGKGGKGGDTATAPVQEKTGNAVTIKLVDGGVSSTDVKRLVPIIGQLLLAAFQSNQLTQSAQSGSFDIFFSPNEGVFYAVLSATAFSGAGTITDFYNEVVAANLDLKDGSGNTLTLTIDTGPDPRG